MKLQDVLAESKMADLDAFCDEVEALVKKNYGHDDGGDLCYNLVEQGVIDPKKHDVKWAAQIVAQHLEQA